MGRFCVALVLLGLLTGCRLGPTEEDTLLAATQRIEKQFAGDAAELANTKKTVHFTPDSGFTKLVKPTVVARAEQLAKNVHVDEGNLWKEQLSQSLEWTKERICSLFGWAEKIKRLKLPYELGTEEQVKMAFERDFISRTSPPSRAYDDAVHHLYVALNTVMGEDSEFAITAVVKVCELTELLG
jgi:hypothetical protein